MWAAQASKLGCQLARFGGAQTPWPQSFFQCPTRFLHHVFSFSNVISKAPPSVVWPAGHALHAESPATSVNVFRAQSAHTASVEAVPTVEAYFPAAHVVCATHDVKPLPSAYLPGAQSWQTALADELHDDCRNFPAVHPAHAVHVVEPTESAKVLPGQARQLRAPSPAANVPVGHAVHSVLSPE
jgi:hypothetical protein